MTWHPLIAYDLHNIRQSKEEVKAAVKAEDAALVFLSLGKM